MERIFPETPEVSQQTADEMAKLVQSHLNRHQVRRAGELPEEARVRLKWALENLFRRVKAKRRFFRRKNDCLD